MLYSLILHIVIFSLALWIVKEKAAEAPKSFTARIVTPEELKEQSVPVPPSRPPKMREERNAMMPRLPKDLPPPKDFSAVPEQRPSGKGRTKAPADRTADIAQRQGELTAKRPSSPVPQNSSGTSRKEELSSSETSQQGVLKHGNESTDTFRKSQPEPGDSRAQSPGTLKEKLYDRAVISQLARRKEREDAKHSGTITFDTTNYKYYGYMQRLKERIEGTWKYPPEAAEKGIYGDLYITFTIKKDGRLGAVELTRTSGHRELDNAALKALRDADPFWPLPDSWGEEALTIPGHFVYALQGIYLR